jgi:hypothetical protein
MSDEWRQILGFVLVFAVVPIAAMVIVFAAYRMFRNRSEMPPGSFSKTFRFSIGSSPDQMPVTGNLDEIQQPQPLDPDVRDRYRRYWERTKDRFDGNPLESVKEAERLLTDLMEERRSSQVSLSEEKESALDLIQTFGGIGDVFATIEHAKAAARGMSAAREGGEANAEDLRQAMQVYESAFEKLLAE